MARIKVITGRSKNQENEKYTFGGVTIDIITRKITIDDNNVDFTVKEYEVLMYLIRNKSIVLSRENILSAVWGYDFYGFDRTVDTHIKLIFIS